MKKIILGLIASVIFGFVGNAQSLMELKSSTNPYNHFGESNFNFLIELCEFSMKNGITKIDLENKLKQSVYGKPVGLNNVEMIYFEVYFKEKELNLKNTIEFENYVLHSQFDFEKDNLLKSIALLKWDIYFALNVTNLIFKSAAPTPRPKGQTFQGCLDNCISNASFAIFSQGNWIDQAVFIGGLPESFAHMAISCAWDCR